MDNCSGYKAKFTYAEVYKYILDGGNLIYEFKRY